MPKPKLTEPVVLKNFLEIPYDELEGMNLEAAAAAETLPPAELEKKYRAYLLKEKRLKAVTLCFTDIEGRFHMLDYDKQYLLRAHDNLTFDGSSIRGFSAQKESDLRLGIDWGSIFWLPSDVFGPGKVILFGTVLNRDKTPYESDFRARLTGLTKELKKERGITANVAGEVPADVWAYWDASCMQGIQGQAVSHGGVARDQGHAPVAQMPGAGLPSRTGGRRLFRTPDWQCITDRL